MGSTPYNVFGGVVFVRKDRRISTVWRISVAEALMAVDETSLGGFQMAWREMQRVGIDPHRDLASLTFTGVHDRVVMAVKEGRVDVGTVRTNILERMAAAGEIELDEFRIIGPKSVPNFRLCARPHFIPEWPFSKLQHTRMNWRNGLRLRCLACPLSSCGTGGNYAGWTVPLDYQSVHELFMELNPPPYQNIGKFTLADAVRKYWYWPLLASFPDNDVHYDNLGCAP